MRTYFLKYNRSDKYTYMLHRAPCTNYSMWQLFAAALTLPRVVGGAGGTRRGCHSITTPCDMPITDTNSSIGGYAPLQAPLPPILLILVVHSMHVLFEFHSTKIDRSCAQTRFVINCRLVLFRRSPGASARSRIARKILIAAKECASLISTGTCISISFG